MAGSGNGNCIKSSDLGDIVKRLSPRWFLMVTRTQRTG